MSGSIRRRMMGADASTPRNWDFTSDDVTLLLLGT
jgi:hypothetical protein